MRFLVDEDLPRTSVNLLKRYGHEAIDVRDIGLRGAKDAVIASYAQQKTLSIITGDFDFSNIRNYPPEQYAGIVVLNIPKDSTANFILNLIEEFLKNHKLVSRISGKLVIVEVGRIRIRKG